MSTTRFSAILVVTRTATSSVEPTMILRTSVNTMKSYSLSNLNVTTIVFGRICKTTDCQFHCFYFSIQTRRDDDKRPTDYLKQEYEARLSKGPVKYKLQIQLHEPQDQDPPQLLHAGRSWDLKTHPWMELADVAITTLLTPDVVERTCYNVANQHSSLGLLPAVSIYDYNSVAQVRAEVYPFSQHMRSLKPPSDQPDDKTTYIIRVETGDQEAAGTDATITIKLTGEKIDGETIGKFY